MLVTISSVAERNSSHSGINPSRWTAFRFNEFRAPVSSSRNMARRIVSRARSGTTRLLLGWIAGSPIARNAWIGPVEVGDAVGRSAMVIVGANRTLNATVMTAKTRAMRIVTRARLTAVPLRPVESENTGAVLAIEYRAPARIQTFCATNPVNP